MATYPLETDRRSRWLAAATTLLIEGGLAALIGLGLTAPATLRGGVEAALTAIRLAPPPPAEPPPAPHHVAHAAGAAAPAAARAQAAPVAAPKVMVPLPRPTAAATHAAQGTMASNGATAAGTGSGAGGSGNGTGAGSAGDGDGSGGAGAEWTKGRIKDSDYPEDARQARAQGTTSAVIAVGTDGRPTGCTVRQSSGNASLDSATCALVMQRFRFRPAHDEAGRPEPDHVDYEQEWSLDRHSFE